MHPHPRTVETGAPTRWLKQALELASRRFWLWLPAALLYLALALLASLSQFALLGVIGLTAASTFTFVYGVLIAAHTDHRLGQKELWRLLRSDLARVHTARVLRTILSDHRLILLVGAFIDTFFISSRFFSPNVFALGAGAITAAFLSLGFSALTLAYIYQANLVGVIGSTHIHRLLAVVLLGVSWEASEPLVTQGCALNRQTLFIGLFLPALLFLALIAIAEAIFYNSLVPLAFGLPILPVGSSLFYVAFRDIYLGQAENSPAPVPQSAGAPEPL